MPCGIPGIGSWSLGRGSAEVEREAKNLGFLFDVEVPGAKDALKTCLTAWRQARADVLRRDAGEIVETPAPAQTITVRPTPPGSPRTLRDVFPLWEASKTRKSDTIQAATRALNLFESACGKPDLPSITRAQGSAFRAWLLQQRTSSKTARDRFDYIKDFLNFAAQDLELLPKSPWRGLNIDHSPTNPGREWSLEELQALFGLPLFTAYELPRVKKAGGPAAYWIPILGLFTGARISELAQLRLEDLETVDGVHVLNITPDGEGQSVKTLAGRRMVPLHNQLISLGFLEYVQDLRAAGESLLFPLVPVREGKPGGIFSNWFNGDLKPKAKRGTKALPRFHDFRHTVRTRLTEVEVAEPMIDALVGHAISGSTGAKVYTHRSPKARRTAINKLTYPGLSLPRIYISKRLSLAPSTTPHH